MGIILIILLILCFIYIFKWSQDVDKHSKWFNSLMPGDNILVTIYGEDCECQKKAMVISEPINKYIEAQLSTEQKNKCINCYKANDSCTYQDTLFHRDIVNKIPE